MAKKLLINCASCDARKIREDDYAHYEAININTAALFTSPEAKAVLNRLPVSIDCANVIELEGDVDLRTVNGRGEIRSEDAEALKSKGASFSSKEVIIARSKVEAMLSEEYAAERRKLITDTAVMPEPGNPYCGGTVYLCTADGEGNMVSWIQSNYQGFGSGMVVPDLGVSFNDRGANFSLDPKSDNFLAPGKKAYHTIIPGFLEPAGGAGRPAVPVGRRQEGPARACGSHRHRPEAGCHGPRDRDYERYLLDGSRRDHLALGR